MIPTGTSSISEWPGPAPSSKWQRWAAYCLAIMLVAVAGYQFGLGWQQIAALRAVPLHVWAETPDAGGWRSDALRVPSGRTVELTVHGVSGVHTFALAHTDVVSRRSLGPGDEETVTFIAPAPGRYVLHCTTWCSPDHWRMRTVLEVYDPADTEAPLAYPLTPTRYPIKVAAHDLDSPHLADLWPEAKPDAAVGAELWASFTPKITPATVLAEAAWPNVSPATLYAGLQSGDFSAGVTAGSADAELWALVAYLQEQASTSAAFWQGKALYQQNCLACHGSDGRGDGFAAPLSVGQEPDLSDLRAAAGASPALYYAKIARGGMGTGMPNWGTILTEDDLWALVDYLQTFSYVPTFKGE